MAAVLEDFTIELGASFQFEFTYVDANDNPIPLSDYTGAMHIRDCKGNLILDISTANARMTIHPTNGTINIDVPKADILSSPAVDNVGKPNDYDMFITSPAPNPVDIKLFKGNIGIIQRITI